MTDIPIPPMVERVARAIAAWHAMRADLSDGEPAWKYCQYGSPEAWADEMWSQHAGEAAAVIEALRNPPDDVIRAAMKPLEGKVPKKPEDWMREPVRTFLDACLGKEIT